MSGRDISELIPPRAHFCEKLVSQNAVESRRGQDVEGSL